MTYYTLTPQRPLNFVGTKKSGSTPPDPELTDMEKLFPRYQDYPTVWYDNQDMSTLYQDIYGTVPVTALGQPVRYQKDKSGAGNDRVDSRSTTELATWEARVNLLENSEFDFDLPSEALGGTAAYASFPGRTRGVHFSASEDITYLNFKFNTPEFADNYTLSFLIKMDDGLAPVLHFDSARSVLYVGINGNNSELTDAVVTPVGDGVYRVQCKPIIPTHMPDNYIVLTKYRANIGRGFTVSALQLEYGNDFTVYQHVRTATDYDDVGAKRYIQIPQGSVFTTTTETPEPAKLPIESATVVAGMLSEQYTWLTSYLEIPAGSDPGMFMMVYPTANTSDAGSAFGGSIKSSSLLGPTEKFSKVSMMCNVQFQPTFYQTIVNNTVYMDNTDVGTGTLWNDALWFFRTRAGVLPFKGRDYGFAMVGVMLPAADQGILLDWSTSNLADN